MILFGIYKFENVASNSTQNVEFEVFFCPLQADNGDDDGERFI